MLIDMHSHVVFGVDDGASSFEESKKMILEAVRHGTTDIISTPHILPGYKRFDFDVYRHNLSQLQKYCHDELVNLNIYQGGEILYTDSLKRMLREEKIPTLADSYCILIEFAGKTTFDGMLRAADIVANEGYTPVFAHIERYSCLNLNREKKINKLKEEYGALMQINASTVVNSNRLFGNRYLWKLIKKGYIDFVASDAHNTTSRTVRLDECVRILDKRMGEGIRKRITEENQQDFLI